MFPLPKGTTSYPPLPVWIALCMIIALGSYELQYNLPGLLKTAVRPEYQDLAQTYWTRYELDDAQMKRLPTGAELLVPGFFERFTADQNSAFLRHLAANRASYWKYDSPIRFHYGLADERSTLPWCSARFRRGAGRRRACRWRGEATAEPSSPVSMAMPPRSRERQHPELVQQPQVNRPRDGASQTSGTGAGAPRPHNADGAPHGMDQSLTASLRPLPGVNFGALEAAIFTACRSAGCGPRGRRGSRPRRSRSR